MEYNYSKTRNILLVEDNIISREVALLVLEKRGYSVCAAASGEEALKALKFRDFDIILMDVQMPAMDGFETTKAIREQEKLTNKRNYIIALTAYTSEKDIEKCMNANMDDYLSKPINMERLYEKLDKYFCFKQSV